MNDEDNARLLLDDDVAIRPALLIKWSQLDYPCTFLVVDKNLAVDDIELSKNTSE